MDQEDGAAYRVIRRESLMALAEKAESHVIRRIAFAIVSFREDIEEEPTVKQIIAWHGDNALKEQTVARMYQHRRLDDFIFGDYQRRDPAGAEGYKGCAVGCTLQVKFDSDGYPIDPEDGWHEEMQKQYGIPTEVAQMIDEMFEDCPDRQTAADFAVDVVEAIPVGGHLYDMAEQFETLVREFAEAAWGSAQSFEFRRRFIQLLSEAPVYPTIPSGEAWGTPVITAG